MSITKVKVKGVQLCPILCDPMNYIVHGILQARILEWVGFPFSRGSSQTRPPALQVDSLPSEPPGKPKNAGVGGLSLLQQIFPTQESNRDLLNCRRILYQMSYQGSPGHQKVKVKSLSCVWLCDPVDCNLPVFSIHGISQARILEWVAISSSRGSSWPRD